MSIPKNLLNLSIMDSYIYLTFFLRLIYFKWMFETFVQGTSFLAFSTYMLSTIGLARLFMVDNRCWWCWQLSRVVSGQPWAQDLSRNNLFQHPYLP